MVPHDENYIIWVNKVNTHFIIDTIKFSKKNSVNDGFGSSSSISRVINEGLVEFYQLINLESSFNYMTKLHKTPNTANLIIWSAACKSVIQSKICRDKPINWVQLATRYFNTTGQGKGSRFTLDWRLLIVLVIRSTIITAGHQTITGLQPMNIEI